MAQAMREAGVRTVNVSLDTLDREDYRLTTGRDLLPEALAGIEAAIVAGFEQIKINCVLMRGRTEEQRRLVDAAKALAKGGSLIPGQLSYKEHLRRFRTQCDRAGIHKVHGHRHRYAQQRYQELVGWECPACGGPTAKQLSAEQKRIDQEARLTVSAELGHGRGQITSVYLGR